MNKNLIIAAVLSIAVIMGFNAFFPPKKPAPANEQAAGVKQEAASPETAEPYKAAEEAKAAKEEKTTATEKAVEGGFNVLPEHVITVETDLISAVFSTRGGVIKSWKLKKYKDDEGVPLEMVTMGNGVLPTLVVPSGMKDSEAAGIPYVCDRDSLDISDGKPKTKIVLTAKSLSGGVITKTLVFDNSSYSFKLDVQVKGYDGFKVATGENFGIMPTGGKRSYGHVGYIFKTDDDIKLLTPKDLFTEPGKGLFSKIKEFLGIKKKPSSYKVDKGWAGNTDNYFLAAIICEQPAEAIAVKGTSDWGYVDMDSEGKQSEEYEFFAGPKEYDELKQIGYGLEQSVDFGFFAFIAKPLFFALKFLHSYVHNYGWAIIIMTVVIKLLFAPLTHHQQKSMKRMQKLQPMMAELKAKHKGDAQKLNAEMMELYKKHKVNPMGGCLPMVIQIPVFFALYKVLYVTIELRQAPFIWWLTDLSAKDPYHVLPILMGVSMFLMQMMTPSSMEGPQAKMFKFLPIVMVAIFWSLPSGLLLYFTVSNLLQMAQQFYINRFTTDEA